MAFHNVEEVTFNVVTGDYVEFIHNLRDRLAGHGDPEDVEGHPVLAKQLHPKHPARWIHVRLVGEKNEATTLAIRDDNVYLKGFQNQNGKWYELGFHGASSRMLPEAYDSTFLDCDVDYGSIVGGAMNLGQVLEQGWGFFARQAVHRLSAYTQAQHAQVDEATKRDLARLILMISGSARMIPHFDAVNDGWDGRSEISEQQVRYLSNWGLMSEALLGRREHGMESPWPQRLIQNASSIISNESEALAGVQLLLNKPPAPAPAAADDDEGHGRPLVEVFAMRANFPVDGAVTVFDGMRGQIIYKPVLQRAAPSPWLDYQGNMLLIGPYRAIAAYGSFAIEVESSNVGGTLFWDCYADADAMYDTPLKRTIATGHGPLQVTYAVLRNAVEVAVRVRLLLDGDSGFATDGSLINGEITARSGSFVVGSVLFSGTGNTSAGSIVPLARSVVAVPLGSPLVIEIARLEVYTHNGMGTTSFDGDLEFYSGGENAKHIRTRHGEVEVMITWSPAFYAPETVYRYA